MDPTTSSTVPEIRETATAHAESCIVVSTKISQHRIFLAAEVDCQDDSGKLVELKTSQIPRHSTGQDRFNRQKLGKWFIQSFLAGIPTIICGFMNDGVLQRVQMLQTLNLPKEAGGAFDYRKMLDFTDKLLTWIQHEVDEGKFYRVTYQPTPLTNIRGGKSAMDPAEYRISITEDVAIREGEGRDFMNEEMRAVVDSLFRHKATSRIAQGSDPTSMAM